MTFILSLCTQRQNKNQKRGCQEKTPGCAAAAYPGVLILIFYFVSIMRISLLLCTNLVMSSGESGL